MSTDATLTTLIEALIAGQTVSLADWPARLGAVEDWGLVSGPAGVELPPSLEPLHGEAIRSAVGGRAEHWLQGLEVHAAIGSTSDRLLALAEAGSVAGMVCLAELQTSGRGRRGRSWLTPLGGNLALSAGFGLARGLADLGGLSLVVGLALLDALQGLDIEDLAVKWPNDLLLGGAKLGGILIELKTTDRNATEAIVGVGININLPPRAREAIDQKVTDLAATGRRVARNALAARVIDHLIDYVGEFERAGFAPMRAQYDACHWMHGKECEVRVGDEVVKGTVLGVTDRGELEVQTAAGPQLFRGGEVSLRERSAAGGVAPR